MPFVKLDCNMLNSTLWFERIAREIFITALLMAEPYEATEELPQIEIRSLDYTGWKVPIGRYGFVAAASTGIIRRAMLGENETEIGLDALEMLGRPEPSSRTSDFDGRRLVRVDGGFVVLNFQKYRDRDYTAARRAKRYRERKKRHAVMSTRHAVSTTNVTQGEAEGEVELLSVESVANKRRAKSEEEVVQYCISIGLSDEDGKWFWDKCEGNGWKNNGKSIANWKSTVSSWKRVGSIFPTQKQSSNGRVARNMIPECLRISPPRDWQEAQRIVRHLWTQKDKHPDFSNQIQDKIDALQAQFKLQG